MAWERNQDECNDPATNPRCNEIFCRELVGVLLAEAKHVDWGHGAPKEDPTEKAHERKPSLLSAFSMSHHPGGDDPTPNQFKLPQCLPLPRTTPHHLMLPSF